MVEPIRLFVFGLGYSASRAVDALRPRAAWIGGTVRSPETAARLRSDGIAAIEFDGKRPGAGVADALQKATHCLVSVPPGEAGDPVLAQHGADILSAESLGWIGYLSTVGVYGNYGGAWVSERTTPHPRPGRSTHRLEAEAVWHALADKAELPIAILRIAGIYGPGRNALKNLADGKARRIIKPGQVFNRIHVEDIAAALVAAAEQRAAGVFNLADDCPAPPQDVVEYAARLMDVAVPPDLPFETAELSPMARSFYGDNKRISNRLIKDKLALVLRYPSFAEGLSAMWTDGTWRGD